MPTDEQRMREAFEAWARGRGHKAFNRSEDGKYLNDYQLNDLWLAYRSRDAEVQALREALERADAVMLKAAHTLSKQHADADAADPLLEAVGQIRHTLAGRNTP